MTQTSSETNIWGDSSKRQKMNDKFFSKMWVGFCFNKGKRSFNGGPILKSTERAGIPLKNSAMDF